jgi:hypothetical protein
MNPLKESYVSPFLALRARFVVGGLVLLLVTLTALPAAWAIQVGPASLTFQAVKGGVDPASQVVMFSKQTFGKVTWKIRDNAGWLSISVPSGTMTTSAKVMVAVSASGLAAGGYRGR